MPSSGSDDLYSRVAGGITDWLDSMPKRVAEQWTGGGRAPFAAPTTEQERFDYYRRAFFNPDGTPNVQGRAAELDRIGLQQYAQALRAVTARREKGVAVLPAAQQARAQAAAKSEQTGGY